MEQCLLRFIAHLFNQVVLGVGFGFFIIFVFCFFVWVLVLFIVRLFDFAMDKKNVLYTYNEVLFSLLKEGNSVKNLEASGGQWLGEISHRTIS